MATYRITVTLETDIDCDDLDDAQTAADDLAENITWPEALYPADDVDVSAESRPIHAIPLTADTHLGRTA